MSHIVPVSRWFGFVFGYAVASSVAMAASFNIGGQFLADRMIEYLVTGMVMMAIGALSLLLFRVIQDRARQRWVRGDPTAKRDGLTGGTGEAGAAGRSS
jgi:hypothetical protein